MIYLVVEYDYENTDIIGVYDNQEKAKKVVEINKERYQIEEYELNALTKTGKDEILSYIRELKEKLNLGGTYE